LSFVFKYSFCTDLLPLQGYIVMFKRHFFPLVTYLYNTNIQIVISLREKLGKIIRVKKCTPIWNILWRVRLRSRHYLVTARQQLRKEGATRKRLATTIPRQSFLWGRVPGYKPQTHEVREWLIENGDRRSGELMARDARRALYWNTGWGAVASLVLSSTGVL
jgi:hypothetical protein